MTDEAMKKVSKSFPELSRSRARSLARDEGGAIAVLFALMLAALIGTMALGVELGKAWNLQTELQHAADACALAGATQLDGSDGARARAIDACVTQVAAPLVENTQRFASDGLGADVTFDTNTAIDTSGGADDGKTLNEDIKFYTSLPISSSPEATSDAEATYIEATVAPRRVDFSFAAVVGAVTSASPPARAVAGTRSSRSGSPLRRPTSTEHSSWPVRSPTKPRHRWRNGPSIGRTGRCCSARPGRSARPARPRSRPRAPRSPCSTSTRSAWPWRQAASAAWGSYAT